MRSAMLAIVFALSATAPVVVSFQTSQGLPPPTFGTAYTTGGVLDYFEMRRFRDWQLNVTVLVPTAELQAVLPNGYEVVNPTAPSQSVTIAFVLQERVELVTTVEGHSPGTFGPVSEVLVVASGRSPVGLVESVIIDNLRSTQDGVDLTNGIFGRHSARLPDMLRVELIAEPGGDMLRFSADAVSGPLNISAEARFSPQGMTSVRNRISSAPFRYVDSSMQPAVPNRSLRAGTSVDQVLLPAASMSFKRDRIRLPHGNLTVLSIASGRIDRWQEFVQKLQ